MNIAESLRTNPHHNTPERKEIENTELRASINLRAPINNPFDNSRVNDFAYEECVKYNDSCIKKKSSRFNASVKSMYFSFDQTQSRISHFSPFRKP